MFDQIRKLVGHSAIYGLGLAGTSVAALILQPIYLHRLGRHAYGMQEMLSVFSSMLLALLLLGVGTVLIKVYVNDCKSEDEKKRLVSSMLLVASLISTVLFAVVIFFAEPLARLVLKDARQTLLLQMSGIGAGLLLVQEIGMVSLRAKQWPVKFITVSLSRVAFILILNIYLVSYRDLGVLGIQMAAVISSAISLTVCLLVLRSELVPRFSSRLVKHVFTLSLPLVPVAIAPWILRASDRYFLTHYLDLSSTGLYAAGYKPAQMVLLLLVTAFQLGWSPMYMANSDKEDAKRLCTNLLRYYMLIFTLGALTISVFSPEILRAIAKPEFWSAAWITPYISVSFLLFGMHNYTLPLFIRWNKGGRLTALMVCTGAASLGLSFLLIPRYGLAGAVASNVASYLVLTVASFIVAHRFYPVPYEYGKMARIFAAAVIVYLLFCGIHATSVATVALKALSMPLFILALFPARIFSPRELEIIRAIPGKAVRGLQIKKAA